MIFTPDVSELCGGLFATSSIGRHFFKDIACLYRYVLLACKQYFSHRGPVDTKIAFICFQ